jgi:hypothetical protein
MAELSNPLLQQTEDRIEGNLAPENRQSYMKIVVAGMHIGLDKGPQSILASLAKSPDPIADAAKGAVSLVLILRKQAQGVMPLIAMVPAAMTLLLKRWISSIAPASPKSASRSWCARRTSSPTFCSSGWASPRRGWRTRRRRCRR